jgi:hypothetical protein
VSVVYAASAHPPKEIHMSRKTILAAIAAALAVAAAAFGPAAARAADPIAPPGFYDGSYRLHVNLEDATHGVFSATLVDIPSSVRYPAAQWLGYSLDASTFDVASSTARCFVVSDKAREVACSKIADLVDHAADGGVDATILARPIDGDPMSFTARKITVWVDASGNDHAPPDEGGSPGGDVAPPPVPPKFYSKNIRLNVNLQDVAEGRVFDATLNEIPGSVPGSFRTYLESVLDASTFEVDASSAACFVIKNNVQNSINCSTLGTWLDQTADDGIDATILARAVAGDDLSFKAKKITVRP